MEPKNALPFNEDAEQSFLGVLLNDSSTIDTLEYHPQAVDFYLERHKLIFITIMELWDMGKPVDLISVVEFLVAEQKLEQAGGRSYIASLLEKGLVGQSAAQYYVDIIIEKSQRRLLIKNAYDMLGRAQDESNEIFSVVEESEKNIFAVTDRSQSALYSKMGLFLDEFFDLIQSRLDIKRGEYSGIRTGFSKLDELLTGLQNGELIVLGARPSVGKTAFALNILRKIALDQKIPAAFFSLEMSGRDIISRIVCQTTGLNNNLIRQNMLDTEHLQVIQKFIATYSEAKLYVSDVSSLSLFDLKVQARRLVQREHVKTIFIDYLGLINYYHRLDDQMLRGHGILPRFEQISEISRALKSLARELDIPIVVLVQLNRESQGKTPNLANIRDSGAIEQDADVVLFLHKDEESAELVHLIIAKQRNGPTGKIDYHFKNLTFHETTMSPFEQEMTAAQTYRSS